MIDRKLILTTIILIILSVFVSAFGEQSQTNWEEFFGNVSSANENNEQEILRMPALNESQREDVGIVANFTHYIPTAPTNFGASPWWLTALNSNTTSIFMAWVDNSGNEDAFDIDRATNSGYTQNLVTWDFAGSTGTGVRLVWDTASPVITDNTQYWYRISAYNVDGGHTNTSAFVASTTNPFWTLDRSRPSAQVVTVTPDAANNEIDLSWSAPSDECGNDCQLSYSVEQSTSNGGTYTPINGWFDDFTDGDYTSNPVWTIGGGTWTAANNDLRRASGANDTTNIYSSTSFSGDYLIEFDYYAAADDGVVFNVTDNSNHYLLALRTSGNEIQLYKKVSGTYTSLGDPVAVDVFTTNTSYNIKVRVRNGTNTYHVYKDDVWQAGYTDSTYTSGFVGFRYGSGTARYDNVKVSPLTTATTLTDTGAVDTTVPAVPTSLSVGSPSSSSLDISWSASSDFGNAFYYKGITFDKQTNYSVFDTVRTDNIITGVKQYWVDCVSGGTCSAGADANDKYITGTSTTVSGLSNDVTYCFKILATDNADNNSALATQQCATTGSPDPVIDTGSWSITPTYPIQNQIVSIAVDITDFDTTLTTAMVTCEFKDPDDASWRQCLNSTSSTMSKSTDTFTATLWTSCLANNSRCNASGTLPNWDNNSANAVGTYDIRITVDDGDGHTDQETTTFVLAPLEVTSNLSFGGGWNTTVITDKKAGDQFQIGEIELTNTGLTGTSVEDLYIGYFARSDSDSYDIDSSNIHQQNGGAVTIRREAWGSWNYTGNAKSNRYIWFYLEFGDSLDGSHDYRWRVTKPAGTIWHGTTPYKYNTEGEDTCATGTDAAGLAYIECNGTYGQASTTEYDSYGVYVRSDNDDLNLFKANFQIEIDGGVTEPNLYLGYALDDNYEADALGVNEADFNLSTAPFELENTGIGDCNYGEGSKTAGQTVNKKCEFRVSDNSEPWLRWRILPYAYARPTANSADTSLVEWSYLDNDDGTYADVQTAEGNHPAGAAWTTASSANAAGWKDIVICSDGNTTGIGIGASAHLCTNACSDTVDSILKSFSNQSKGIHDEDDNGDTDFCDAGTWRDCDANGETADCPADFTCNGSNTCVADNVAPIFTSASDDATTIKGGSTVTVTTVTSDSNDGDTTKLVVCKTTGVTGTDCDGGAGDRYCTVTNSADADNPTCNWTSETDDTTHNWYAYIFDTAGVAASGNYKTGAYVTDSTAPTGTTLGFGTINHNSIIATVSGASDSGSGLHSSTPYYFDEAVAPSNSGWQAGTSWVDGSLSVNVQYTYKVRSRDDVDNQSSYTATQSKYTLALVPGGPTVNGAAATTLDVTLDVNGNPGATQFVIDCTGANCPANGYVQANGSLGASKVWQDNATWGTKTVTGLSSNTEYCFKVQARNGDNVETVFNPTEVCATTNLDIPPAPTNLQVDYNSLYVINSATGAAILTWTDNSGNEDGFKVWRSDNNFTTETLVTTTAANITSYDDLALTDNITYWYIVGATNSDGDTNTSIDVNITVDRDAPTVPANFTAVQNGLNIDLNWGLSDDNSSYVDLINSALGYWRFEEGSGTSAYDSANGNTGTISGAAYVTGKIGKGLNFDGVNDGVDIASISTPLRSSNTFTISFWAIGGHGINKAAFTLSDGGSSAEGFNIYPYDFGTGDGVRVWYGGNLIDENDETRTGWNHFVFVSRSATDHEVFVNGVSQGTSSTSKTLYPELDQAWIGQWKPDNQVFDGSIDEVIVFNTNLSNADINALYVRGVRRYDVNRSSDGGASWSSVSQVFDVNTLIDSSPVDSAVPDTPTNTSVNGPTTSSLNVDWNASSDNGTVNDYNLTVFDAFTNFPNDVAASATFTSGVKQYFVNCISGGSCASGADANDKYISDPTTTTTVSGLDVNVSYCFTLLGTDNSDNNSNATSQSCNFTFANVPSAPGVDNATVTTLDVTVNVNSNPVATQFAIDCTGANCPANGWVQTNGALGASEVWQTNAQWSTKTVTGLTGNTEYCFKVKARNGNLVETVLSSQACGTTDLGTPDAPTNLVVDVNSTYAFNSELGGTILNWTDNASNENGFKVWRSTDNFASAFVLVTTTAANATSYSDNSLNDNTGYWYTVGATNGDGDSNSNIDSNFTLDRTAPVNSGDLAGVYALDQTNLTWSKGTDNNVSQADIDYNVMRSTTAIDNNLSYSILTKLDDAASYSDTTGTDNANPNVPSISNVNADSNVQLTVSWNSVLDNNSTYFYKIDLLDLEGNDANTNAITSISHSGISKYWVTNVTTSGVDLNTAVTSFVASGLDVNSSYCFTVHSADRADNNSSVSSQSCKFTFANVPSVPDVDNATTNTLDVTVNVNSNPGATQFAIDCTGANCPANGWVQDNGALGASEVWRTNAQWSTKTITGLSSNTEYCFQAKARNGNLVETILGAPGCGTPANFLVRTSVKDVNGFFDSTNPDNWIPQWTNVDVNAHLICTGGTAAFQNFSFGPGVSSSNYFAWSDVVDTNVTYSSGITLGSVFGDSVLSLNTNAITGDVNIVIRNGSSSTKWTQYSAWIEPYNYNPQYLGVNVRHREASTRAGLSSVTWSNFGPPNYELADVNGQWIEFNVRLFRNTDIAIVTDSLALKGFIVDYSSTSQDNSCQATYYRVDTDSSSTESFEPTDDSESGSVFKDSANWRLLDATDKNIFFNQDGNYALKFFSRSTTNNDETPRQINVLIKKFPDQINLDNICSSLQDSTIIDVDWADSTTTEGVYKYRLFGAPTSDFTTRKLLFESGSTTQATIDIATDSNFNVCGDGVCSLSENCPTDSLECNFGEICSNGCQTQTAVIYTSNPTDCFPGLNDSSLDSWCTDIFGAGYACIDGCVPTSDSQFSNNTWDTNTSNTTSNFCGDGFCDSSEFCPRDNSFCGNGFACVTGCQATQDTCGDGNCGQFENCSLDDAVCGAGFACIDGCVPTDIANAPTDYFVPLYSTTGSPINLNQAGDGYCETIASGDAVNEFSPFDNRYCSEILGITNGICVDGCRGPLATTGNYILDSSFTTISCGDGICGIGEFCPTDNAACGSGEACIAGCIPSTGDFINNPEKTRYDAGAGSLDGAIWLQLEVESVTGSRVRSPAISCIIDTESPFQIPTDGRSLVKQIQSGWGDLNLNFGSNVFSSDNNVIIDANTNAPAFTNGTLLQAYNFNVFGGQYDFTNKPRLTLDINVLALSCNPGCTSADLNNLSIYDYNETIGQWQKVSSTVDLDNNTVWADLNHFSVYGLGEEDEDSGGGAVCGNNVIETGETCDDGNTVGGDGCDAQCLIEGSGGPFCGDGRVEGTETCDDGNLIDGDGCDSSCQIEPDPVCDEGETRACNTCGFETCSNDSWGTCNEPSVCGTVDLTIPAFSNDSRVEYLVDGNVALNIQNIGETTKRSFDVEITADDGSYSDSVKINGLDAGDAVGVLFSIPWNESWVGTSKDFTVRADSKDKIDEANETNNEVRFTMDFGQLEICGNLIDDDFDGLIDNGCGLPNLKITNFEVGVPTYLDNSLIQVDFNIIVETEFEDVAIEFAVAYFKDSLQANDKITIELIDSIVIGEKVKLIFVYTAPIGEVFRLEGDPAYSEDFGSTVFFGSLTNFYVEVDSDGTVSEVNEADNLLILNIENLVPDLTFSESDIPSTSIQGNTVNITATVANVGQTIAFAGTYSVSLFLDDLVVNTITGIQLAPNDVWEIAFNLSGLTEDTYVIKLKVDSLDELVESNELNNEVESQHDVLSSLDEIYIYKRYVDREPVIVGAWNRLINPYLFVFNIPQTTILTRSIISLLGLAPENAFEINLLRDSFTPQIYDISITRDGFNLANKDFEVIPSNVPNVISETNDRTVDWVLDPVFLKMMHYERINQLSFVWWELFSEK